MSDKEIWKSIKKKWCKKFSVDEEKLGAIIRFCFSIELKSQMRHVLDMPNQLFNKFEFELSKAVKRSLANIENFDAIRKLRKRHRFDPVILEGDETSYCLIKEDGKWIKKY